MKRFQVLLVVGAIALLAGLNILVFGLIPRDTGLVPYSFTIPTGDGWHYLYEFDMGPGMTLEGDFRVPAGAPIRVLVFTSSQYETYVGFGSIGAPLFQRSGTSGSFSFTAEDSGKYFLVFEHLSSTSAQDVNANIRVSGNNYIVALVGGLVTAVGAGLLAWGASEKSRAEKMAPPLVPFGQGPAAGVMFFPPPPPDARIVPAVAPKGANGPEDPPAGTEGRPGPGREL